MSGSIQYSFFTEAALKSTALLGVGLLAVSLLRRKSAAVRHQVWSAAFAALLILPLLSVALPALRVPVASSLLAPNLVFRTNAAGTAAEPARQAGSNTTAELPARSATRVDGGRILMTLWAAGAAASFAQMLIGWAALERLRRRAHACDMPGFEAMRKLLEIENEVRLLETANGSMPIMYGLFSPVIFLPADATEWNAERRRVVLLHELAHVRRRDGATHLLARTALVFYWWNPLAWTAWRLFLKERERAADDLVLGAGADAPEYAGHLLEIARSMQLPAAFGWAAIAMARRPQLEDRLLAILDSARDRTTPHRGSALALSLAAIGILVPVAALQAKSDTGQAAAVSQATAGSAAALIEEGDAARGHHRFDEAKKLYGRALKAAGGSGPEAATALIDRGEIELAAKDHALAEDDFEKAEAADSGKASEARMWTAISQQHQNNLDAADGFYQSALAADDPNSASAATIMELYAKLLRQQDKNEEAKKMRDQAATIRATQAAQARSMNQPSSADVRRIGGDVKAPVLVSKVEPEYSEEGRIAKYDGSALLSIEVGADGLVRDIKVVRGLGFGLDLKAVEAVSKWRFKPATENGQAVTVSAQVEVRFRLL